ncbi:MAG: thioredoxin family protein [Sedimentisphaerales bacterium]|nr:thioredoxin family protein [Sedimentisphaerales bacterium]
MPFTPDFLKDVFNQAKDWDGYLATGTDELQNRWQDVYNAAGLTQEQHALLQSFVRQMNVLVMSGIWCGDCVEQCPLLARIAQASPKINLRFIDREARPDLRDNLIINTGTRVPVVLFMAEDFAFCSWYGDRTLNRYRLMARKQLGAACSTGLFIPDKEELAVTLADWLGEFERIQLMLRLSTRLRQQYSD